jgi:hypothetical protein
MDEHGPDIRHGSGSGFYARTVPRLLSLLHALVRYCQELFGIRTVFRKTGLAGAHGKNILLAKGQPDLARHLPTLFRLGVTLRWPSPRRKSKFARAQQVYAVSGGRNFPIYQVLTPKY